MATIKNVSGQTLLVPSLGDRLVQKGQEIEVPAEDGYSFTQSANWDAHDDEAKAAETEAEADYQARLAAETAPEEPVAQPKGSASRDEWAAYVVAAGLAAPDALDGKGRDEIRDTYQVQED